MWTRLQSCQLDVVEFLIVGTTYTLAQTHLVNHNAILSRDYNDHLKNLCNYPHE